MRIFPDSAELLRMCPGDIEPVELTRICPGDIPSAELLRTCPEDIDPVELTRICPEDKRGERADRERGDSASIDREPGERGDGERGDDCGDNEMGPVLLLNGDCRQIYRWRVSVCRCR